MNAHLQRGLPEPLRAQAAGLYWEAFGGKLGRVMGPAPKALAYLERVILADHVIVALDPAGDLLGIAGFKTSDGSFAGGGMRDLRACYGWFGALWRGALLGLLTREVDNDRFLLDGICVTRRARGVGIGSALMAAIDGEARARGYSQIRLDVIDANWRAKALYRRLGFVAQKPDNLGPLRWVFGFRFATSMIKSLR